MIWIIWTQAFEADGVMINSGPFNGLDSKQGITKVIEYMEAKGIGEGKVNFRLRDWLISRQRYWGAPIPILYCDKCGMVPVPEEDLPVLLPTDVKFTGKVTRPLAPANHLFIPHAQSVEEVPNVKLIPWIPLYALPSTF